MSLSRAPLPPDGRPRDRRLLVASRRREASVERLPELLPCICPHCGVVLGLAEADQELHCHDCGQWAPADESLSRISTVLA